MEEQLQRIFDLKKVTFDKPSDSHEQRAIFVQMEKADIRIRDKREIANARGVLHVFAPNDEMPYGYFAKKIAEAKPEDTAGWFFGPEEPVGVIRNVLQRRMDFQFLFDGQYDPNVGRLESITLSVTET